MLTDDQRLLVEENTPLAVKRGWRWKYKLEEYGIFPLDECIAMCYEGLCKAAKGYDESKGVKFSTFAYRCMDNEFYLWFKYNSKQKRKANIETESIHKVIHTDKNGVDTTLLELIPSLNESDESDNHVLVQTLLNNLNQKEIDYLTMYYLQRKTYREIGEHYGTSYQAAQTKIKNTVVKCKRLMKLEVI